MIAKVIISNTHSQVDKFFDYLVPAELEEGLQCGMRVIVPFGRRNTKLEGYVIDLDAESALPESRLKPVLKVLDHKPVFSEESLKIAFWMKEQYYTTLSHCLQVMMPPGMKLTGGWYLALTGKESQEPLTEGERQLIALLKASKGSIAENKVSDQFQKDMHPVINSLQRKGVLRTYQQMKRSAHSLVEGYVFLNQEDAGYREQREALQQNKRAKAQLSAIEALEKGLDGSKLSLWKEKAGVSSATVKALQEKKLIMIQKQEVRRNAINMEEIQQTSALQLHEEQQTAYNCIAEEYHKEKKRPILLFGVTGSGKTEVYLQVIDMALKEGKQAIVLVPEISLTPQMVNRFVSRFGGKVSVTHSRMSQGERLDQWKKAQEGEIAVMIGPRSAVFTPFQELGVIIIDEEQENTYKSDTTPKYDAREVAEERSRLTGCLFLMGSATPAIKSYYKAQTGQYRLLKLTKRVAGSMLPDVSIVDMRKELAGGNRSIFSRGLYEDIRRNIEAGHQTILFLNRRGFSTFVSCRKCGHTMTCDNCSVAYTYHKASNELVCHYCGKRVKNPEVCPACGSKYIKYFGAGTQKIENEVVKLFPDARVLRLDMDTAAGKDSVKNILEDFGKGGAEILIGTQMIAKGHDFPNVTLVGVLAADLSLHNGDYRGGEITFQLLTQVAGRAGRDKLPGRVYIQTYQPEHYAVVLAAQQNYEAFYEAEIQYRSLLAYPPFSNIFMLVFLGKNEKQVIEEAYRFKDIVFSMEKQEGFSVLGPAPAFISKVNNDYRWKILLKGTEEEPLRRFVLACLGKFQEGKSGGVLINATMNPVFIV